VVAVRGAPLSPLARRRLCRWCGVEVLSVDIGCAAVDVEVGEADSPPMGEAVLLGERDEARRCRPFTPRRKGEALHRVHVCALADVA